MGIGTLRQYYTPKERGDDVPPAPKDPNETPKPVVNIPDNRFVRRTQFNEHIVTSKAALALAEKEQAAADAKKARE